MADPWQSPGKGRDTERCKDEDTATVVDETVSRAYRELARERAPAALDERLRARARQAPPGRNWQRPLAVAAALAVAVSLVLQVGTPPDGGASGDIPVGTGPAPRATAPAARQRPEEEKTLPAYARQPDRPDPGQAVSDLSRASRKAAQSLAGIAAEPASARCTEHVADADAWLACIGELETAGEEAAAERERRAWTLRHGPEAAPTD